MPRLKILYYNWTDCDDPDQRGGGVSIYQRNLINAATRHGDDVWFLSSGTSYSPFSFAPFLREVDDPSPIRKFELVNSPIISPGQVAFGLDVANEPRMEKLFTEFLQRHGPFDVIHFNNLEGIPISFLKIAADHAIATKVVYSLHNYFAFCPQVNLWFQEKSCCKDYRGGRKCLTCLPTPKSSFGLRWRYRIEYCLRNLGIRPGSLPWQWARAYGFNSLRLAINAAKLSLGLMTGKTPGLPSAARMPTDKPLLLVGPVTASRFAGRRREYVAALNDYADHVLAVSGRVAQLAVEYGIKPNKVRTEYIGTRFAASATADCDQARHVLPDRPTRRVRNTIRLLYLGYMRRDKGFYFYLKALEKAPPRIASRLELIFATKVGDPLAYTRIRNMAHRFESLTYFNGYTHAQLPRILANVDLAVVPVLWEDNLPQVAIECVASGVPILTSDRGGSRELLDNPDLVFKAGSRAEFYSRLESILQNPDILRTALAHRRPLLTPEQHYERLRTGIYQSSSADPATALEPRRYLLTADAPV